MAGCSTTAPLKENAVATPKYKTGDCLASNDGNPTQITVTGVVDNKDYVLYIDTGAESGVVIAKGSEVDKNTSKVECGKPVTAEESFE